MPIPSKILKAQLSLLFLLTVIAFFAFYYSESMPDSSFAISSESESINYLSYYFTSAVALTGHLTGPWVIAPFLLFAIFYSLLYSQREDWIDTGNIVGLLLGSLAITELAAPDWVGRGLSYTLKANFETWELVLTAFVGITWFLAGSFRASFKDNVMMLLRGLARVPGLLGSAISKVDLQGSLARVKEIGRSSTGIARGAVARLLRRDVAEESPLKKSLPALRAETPKRVSAPMIERPKKVVPKVEETDDLAFDASDEDELEEADVEAAPRVWGSHSGASGPYSDEQYYGIVSSLSKRKASYEPHHPDDVYFEDIIRRIQDKLSEFKIDGQIINVLKGPVVDTFELELGSGVRVSKVINAEKDLSMALLGAPIRIVYPMIGRPTVGIEVPRNPREYILLEEVLNSDEFEASSSILPIAMGKNAFGEVFVVDLAAMPHMLVAGATGAGKSVFINSLLVSLLLKKSPNQMKLLLIDPKQLELALYSKLPHLVLPVVTDAKMAAISLLWAVQEMERRYSILKELGVRNIEGFNQKLKRATPDMLANIHGFYEEETGDNYELPYLVIIVDEFADLILTKAGKDIENNICRLAAKARAAGIHLVIATQRPSVDVITGLIKSNFPTRVSFRVTSAVDSRTILDKQGAEKLLGKGDMLYRHGTSNIRVHSSYVDEEEIESLAEKLSDMTQTFHPGAMSFIENGGLDDQGPGAVHVSFGGGGFEGGSDDDLYKKAVRIVVEHRAASASMLQRRLSIGYNRAANLIEEMEAKGVVGPAEGSKRRKVLMVPDEMT
jgi:S-DNA-T family DNA segregation ATPase FtsK/SpoIIIE